MKQWWKFMPKWQVGLIITTGVLAICAVPVAITVPLVLTSKGQSDDYEQVDLSEIKNLSFTHLDLNHTYIDILKGVLASLITADPKLAALDPNVDNNADVRFTLQDDQNRPISTSKYNQYIALSYADTEFKVTVEARSISTILKSGSKNSYWVTLNKISLIDYPIPPATMELWPWFSVMDLVTTLKHYVFLALENQFKADYQLNFTSDDFNLDFPDYPDQQFTYIPSPLPGATTLRFAISGALTNRYFTATDKQAYTLNDTQYNLADLNLSSLLASLNYDIVTAYSTLNTAILDYFKANINPHITSDDFTIPEITDPDKKFTTPGDFNFKIVANSTTGKYLRNTSPTYTLEITKLDLSLDKYNLAAAINNWEYTIANTVEDLKTQISATLNSYISGVKISADDLEINWLTSSTVNTDTHIAGSDDLQFRVVGSATSDYVDSTAQSPIYDLGNTLLDISTAVFDFSSDFKNQFAVGSSDSNVINTTDEWFASRLVDYSLSEIKAAMTVSVTDATTGQTISVLSADDFNITVTANPAAANQLFTSSKTYTFTPIDRADISTLAGGITFGTYTVNSTLVSKVISDVLDQIYADYPIAGLPNYYSCTIRDQSGTFLDPNDTFISATTFYIEVNALDNNPALYGYMSLLFQVT